MFVQLGGVLPSGADYLNAQFMQGWPCGKKTHVHAVQGFGLRAFKSKRRVQICMPAVFIVPGIFVMVCMRLGFNSRCGRRVLL